MNTARLGPNQRLALKLLAASAEGMTRSELQAALHITDLRSVQAMLKSLRGRGLIHISAWRYESAGASCPACRVFAAGKGEDAKKPEPMGAIQRKHRYVEKVGRELFRQADAARSRGASRLVIDGEVVWQRGDGFGLRSGGIKPARLAA